MDSELLIDGPGTAEWTFFFAHGAGAPMDTPFMDTIASGLAEAGIRVVRFEFPYMAARRTTGKRAGPNRMPALLDAFRDVLGAVDARRVAIGGKSMGGRVASMLAAAEPVAERVVCLGYPFHPPGKPEKLRTEHLAAMTVPTLIVQGMRDTFGTPDEVSGYGLPDAISVRWLEDGDHSFKPRVRSGHTLDGHLAEAVRAVAAFLAT